MAKKGMKEGNEGEKLNSREGGEEGGKDVHFAKFARSLEQLKQKFLPG